jgi:predicted RNA-binding protein with EMAP domain
MMTNQQIAQEVLYAYMDVEKDLSQPKILIHTLKKLRELISGTNENVDWRDECNVSYVNGYDDCLKSIDAVCDELGVL